MGLNDVYLIGDIYKLPLSIKKLDDRLSFVRFPYMSDQIFTTCLYTMALSGALFLLAKIIFPFIASVIFFLGIIIAMVLYIYPVHIYYFQKMGDYNEEMLRAILRISTYIQMGTSIEYAMVESTPFLSGTLQDQFQDIKNQLSRRTKTGIGGVLQEYTPIWNSVNPLFVKSLRLLQIAGMTPKEERDTIIRETVETFLLNYNEQGRRFAEELADNAKKLIGMGILLPVMSLMMLPIVGIFLTDKSTGEPLIKISMLFFIYNVLFPTLTLLMALNFSVKRVQTDTIQIEQASTYEPLPRWVYYVGIVIAVLFAIPGIVHLQTIDLDLNPDREYSFNSVFYVWLIGFGLVMAVVWVSMFFIRKNRDLWQDIYEIERDLPHLLQGFSTYSNMNIPMENIIPEIIDDYERFGFGKHPVVRLFRQLRHMMIYSKKTVYDLMSKSFHRLCPSKKVNDILNQLMSFSKISQKSSARLAKTVREQVISLYKLDDYLKSMLAETVGLIGITCSMLAPLLCAAAVMMGLVIVKSLTYIMAQLESISKIGGGEGMSLEFINITKIIPPTQIELVVAIYLVETIIILSFFVATINIGKDRFQIVRTILSNIGIGFAVYSVILFVGYYFMMNFLFAQVLV
jgi:hypothetical protein